MLAPCQDLPDRASLLYHFHRARRYFQRRPDKSAGMFPRGELGPMGRKSETELYLPVKAYFEERGFKVRAEVRNCDLAAVKEDSLVIVELKTSFNLELVLQGVERQQICAAVFLAVPRPRNMQTSRWRRILRLCRALGLGLLTVSAHGLVEAVCQPLGQAPRQNRREKKLLLRPLGRFQHRGQPTQAAGYRLPGTSLAHCQLYWPKPATAPRYCPRHRHRQSPEHTPKKLLSLV